MAIIGLGSQSEFQAQAFKATMGVRKLKVYDTDPSATQKFLRNMAASDIEIEVAEGVGDAVVGVDIITTITADKKHQAVLSPNHIGAGVHINAVGGDCPGKTELHKAILERSSIFVEFAPQTRAEGEIQQMPVDCPVTELWEVIAGEKPGRQSEREVTIFDSVGFAIEDFSALRYVHDVFGSSEDCATLDLLPDPSDPRDLFGLLRKKSLVESEAPSPVC